MSPTHARRLAAARSYAQRGGSTKKASKQRKKSSLEQTFWIVGGFDLMNQLQIFKIVNINLGFKGHNYLVPTKLHTCVQDEEFKEKMLRVERETCL